MSICGIYTWALRSFLGTSLGPKYEKKKHSLLGQGFFGARTAIPALGLEVSDSECMSELQLVSYKFSLNQDVD